MQKAYHHANWDICEGRGGGGGLHMSTVKHTARQYNDHPLFFILLFTMILNIHLIYLSLVWLNSLSLPLHGVPAQSTLKTREGLAILDGVPSAYRHYVFTLVIVLLPLPSPPPSPPPPPPLLVLTVTPPPLPLLP